MPIIKLNRRDRSLPWELARRGIYGPSLAGRPVVDGFYRKEDNAGESANDTSDPAYSWRQESNSEFGVQVHGGIRINFLKYFYIKGQLHIRPFWYFSRDAHYSDTSGRETSGSISKFKILGPQMNQHLVTLGVQI